MRVALNTQTSMALPESHSQTDHVHSSFSETLSAIQTNNQRQLNEFLTRLDTIGNRLAETLSLQDLTEFRDLVKSFLQATLGKSRKMQEETFWDGHGRPKVLARVTEINKVLDELGRQVLDKHPRPLDVLARIDQIRGLILDLFA